MRPIQRLASTAADAKPPSRSAQKRIMGAYYGSASPYETFGTIVELYLRGELNCDDLVQRRYPLEQINEGFEALDRGENGRGVIVF